MFGIQSNVHTSAELARAKDITGYLSSGKVQLHTLAVTKNTRWRDCCFILNLCFPAFSLADEDTGHVGLLECRMSVLRKSGQNSADLW